MNDEADRVLVRDERPEDAAEIAEVTRLAFVDHPDAGLTEGRIIEALRAADALSVSLVAEHTGRVVGHIGFSTVEISDGSRGWFGLGPLSVAPAMQGRGIGSRLVIEGLARLQSVGASGCVVLGDEGFYGRFGFDDDHDLVLQSVPQTFFHALKFTPGQPHGRVTFHPVFSRVAVQGE
jgi:putative acetyltransferase